MSKKSTAEFNWITALEAAVLKSPGTKTHARLAGLAKQWPTCACWQLCKSLPRDKEGAPKDLELQRLGRDFYWFIETGHWAVALRIFRKIESRTTLLLSKMAKEKGGVN